MSAVEITNPQSLNTQSINDPERCQHRTPSGRRCKLPVEPGHLLCCTHVLALKKSDALNLKAALLTDSEDFQTAQGINNSLGSLYKLLANNYISPRRAAVLAYINSLLLRTLPAIDADQEAGITDSAEDDHDDTDANLTNETAPVREGPVTASSGRTDPEPKAGAVLISFESLQDKEPT